MNSAAPWMSGHIEEGYMTTQPSNVTPNDLRSMRTRIGLDRNELAQLMGIPGRGDILEQLERGRKWTLYTNHRDTLLPLCEAFDDALEWMLSTPTPPVFVVYPNDGAYRDYEPILAKRLPYNSLHRMLVARWREAVTDSDVGPPQVVEIIPGKYEGWLAETGADDTVEARQKWCLDYLPIYKMKQGSPVPGAPEA